MSPRQQLTLAPLGVVLIALALVTSAKDGPATVPLAVIFAVAGVLILVIAITGQLISEFGVWKIWVKFRNAVKELESKPFIEPTPEPIDSEPPAAEQKVFEEDQASQHTATTKDNKEVAVFQLHEVPLTVLTSLIDNWPDNPKKPDNFSGFRYAARRRGKGNFAWYIKFEDRAFWLSYGRGGVKVSLADDEESVPDAERHFAQLKAIYDLGQGANEEATQAYNRLLAACGRANPEDQITIRRLVDRADTMLAEMRGRTDECGEAS